ncbi:MAG: carbohydrate ABC transporter permease [Clostridia bacterium]|nr:carbohydrate ABC transporter permease [Clostridia bacterium]
MDNSVNETPQVLKETKNTIKVDFERTSRAERMKIKYLNVSYFGLLVWRIFRFLLLVGVSYVILYPFFSKIAASFMSAEDFVDVTVKLIPKYPTLDTYKAIILDLRYFEGLVNTVLIALVCALIQTFMSCLIGYGFAKFKFPGSKLLFACVMFTMIVPHSTIQLSLFMKFKYFDIFGIIELLGIGKGFIELTNTYWPLAILSFGGLAFKNGLYIFLMRQFFKGVPDELEESAYIDGSGIFRTFVQIILPLSVPMMITIFMFAFSWQWTDEFYVSLFFTKTKTYLLPDLVGQTPKSLDTQYAGQSLYEAAIQNTIGLMIITPLLILYLIFQRHLVQGIERSGITG